jgi:glyoxylase-like metal-dependent hydrolase (beta-lactamase superfamily II)
MTTRNTAKTDLHWDVLTITRPGLTRDLPAGKEKLMWVSNSSILIYGKRDAVLVDTFLTKEQSQKLVDWVVESGKNLTAIYVTHGHGDHFFGLASLLERFPNAKAVANPEIVEAMQDQLSPASLDGFWRRLFPGEIDFNRLDTATATARELYDAMLKIYPDFVNPGSLWGAANTAKPANSQ